MKRLQFIILGVTLVAGAVLAQRQPWTGNGFGGDKYYPEYETTRTAREVPAHSTTTPNWTNDPAFEKDVFTFARVRYDRLEYVRWGGGFWWSDFPDSDLNLSFRLQQVTSLRTSPDGRVIDLTD